MVRKVANKAPKSAQLEAKFGFQNRLRPAQERTRSDTQHDTQKHKPVNAWNGKRVQVETNVSIFCKCPQGIAKYCLIACKNFTHKPSERKPEVDRACLCVRVLPVATHG